MRIISLLLIVLLVACQNAPVPGDAVGSFAWMERVDHDLSISDGQGHGPDYGSQEWCNAVHFKLYGEYPPGPVGCGQDWMQDVHDALRQARPRR